jgi:hypothetical protein
VSDHISFAARKVNIASNLRGRDLGEELTRSDRVGSPSVRGSSGVRRVSSATTTTDHDEIRHWAEARGGRISKVKGTGGKNDPGMLRIDFDDPDPSLEEI